MRVAESVILQTDLDPWLSLEALSRYSGLSVRKLRHCLTRPLSPLPHFRVSRKILVRRSEFTAWRTRHEAPVDLDRIIQEALAAVREEHLAEAARRRDKRRIVARHHREALFTVLGRACVFCRATRDLTFDHIIPWSRGGKTELPNLRVLCRRCNAKRGNHLDPNSGHTPGTPGT